MSPGMIGLNAVQRRTANVALNTPLPVVPFVAKASEITMIALNLTADLMVKNRTRAKQVCSKNKVGVWAGEGGGGGGGREPYKSKGPDK